MSNIRKEQNKQIQGGILGLLVGDALGVPYEFHSKENIPALQEIDYQPPMGFDRAHKGILPGTWSDDGAQALCLLASLLHCKQLDMTDFSNRLLNWYENGYMAVDHNVFDVGIATGRGLRAFKSGTNPMLAGDLDPDSHGNGALMRVLPLALWHIGSDKELIMDAARQACITHAQPRSKLCCGIYCMVARGILNCVDDPWTYAISKIADCYHDDHKMLAELEFHIRPFDDIEPTGSGYVVDTLRAAKKALSINSYQHGVRYAVSLGQDTDTTACIVGGIIGLRDGVETIPNVWLEGLRGKDLCMPMIEKLLSL